MYLTVGNTPLSLKSGSHREEEKDARRKLEEKRKRAQEKSDG